MWKQFNNIGTDEGIIMNLKVEGRNEESMDISARNDADVNAMEHRDKATDTVNEDFQS